jgi:hypothetical protein
MRKSMSSLAILAGILFFTSLIPTGLAQTPASQPLVQQGNLRYLGSFGIPANDGSAAATGDLIYGGTAASLSPGGGLFLTGHDWTQRLCEVSIPAIGGMATIRQRCVDVTEGRMSQVDSSTIKLGGSLVYNGRLIVSAFSYYDADNNQTKSHFASGATLATGGDVTGPVQVGATGAGFVSGYMGLIPAEWRGLLGGPALTGNCCLSIISRTSSGPAVSVFNPDDIGRVSPVPATQVVGYPLSAPLANADTANEYYTRADRIGGFAFASGTRSVLFVGRHGAGQPCYGTGADCNDPTNASKGEHAYPYVHQVWAYDANDLVAVKNGTRQASQLRPYAVWRLTEMDNNGSAGVSGVTFDPATRRIYVTIASSTAPRVHVYEITNGTTPPPPTAEVCGDGIDNDQDGQIDEGCTVGNPPPPPTPEICDGIDNDGDGQIDEGCSAPPPGGPAEVCGDGVDNDQDGQVDEACPGPPQRLTGEVRNNGLSLSWLAPITGTVPTEYVIEAGVAPGQPVYSISTGKKTSTQVKNVGNGRYYVRVRAKNAAGGSVPSNEVAVSVGCATSPSALTNLVSQVRGALVTMTWTDPDGCADTAYRVSLSDRPGGPSLLEVPTESNALSGLAGPGVYYARATAITRHGASAPSNEVRIVVTNGTCVPPQFTTNLASGVSGSVVQLAWNPDSISEALAADAVAPLIYVLEVGTGPGLTNLVRTPLGRTTFMSTPAPSGTYYVRVRPADVCGLGTPSNEVIVQVP